MGECAGRIETEGEEFREAGGEREAGGGKGEVGTPVRRSLSAEGNGSGGGGKGKSIGVGKLGQELKKRTQLLKFNSIPNYLQDNEFITKYYRQNLPFKQTLLSVFAIHNETLNIWTHLLGFFLFLGLTIYTAIKLPDIAEQFSRLQSLGWDDLADMVAPRPQSPITRWPFFVFLSGAMFCLLCSSVCHILLSSSKRLASAATRMDYAGIVSLIAASFYPPVYYSFMCMPLFCNIYLISITSIGVATILVSLLPTFQTVEYRPFRAMLFLSMGLSGVIPCVHKLLLYWNEPVAFRTFLLEISMGSLYALGAVIYATRVPERWSPGRFDILGHSHQIFHLLVLAGAITHYRAGLLYLTWRDAQGCPGITNQST